MRSRVNGNPLKSTLKSQFMLGSLRLSLVDPSTHSLLSEFASRLCLLEPDTSQPDIEIYHDADGLKCRWFNDFKKPLQLAVETQKFVNQQRSFPAPKQGAINQAIGRKHKSVIDATGGWGGDALLLCSQGYEVTIIERNPLMALLLKDAMQRSPLTAWASRVGASLPSVIEADAIRFFRDSNNASLLEKSCAYLDPMFPPKAKASAAVNKNIKFLQFLVGRDSDATEMAEAAISSPVSRVVIKRPHHAKPLAQETKERFSSKLVHYDVYLC